LTLLLDTIMCTGHFKEISITGFLLGPKAHPSCGKTSRILDDERRKSALNKTFQKRGRIKTIIIAVSTLEQCTAHGVPVVKNALQ